MRFMDLFSCFPTRARRNRMRARKMNHYQYRMKSASEKNTRSSNSNNSSLYEKYLEVVLAQPKRIVPTPLSTPAENMDTSSFVLHDNVYFVSMPRQDDTGDSYYGPMCSTPLPSASSINPCVSVDAITKDSDAAIYVDGVNWLPRTTNIPYSSCNIPYLVKHSSMVVRPLITE